MKHLVSLAAAIAVIAAAALSQFGLPGFGLADGTPQVSAGQGEPGGPTSAPGGPGMPRAPGATYVTTAAIEIKPYTDTYSAIGTGVANKSVSLVSDVSGQITDVLVDGTPDVEAGDILIQLDDTVERINADIALTNLDKAQDSLDRYVSLQKANSGVVTDVAMKEAYAEVAVAKGNLALAEDTLSRRAIRAPISGKLGLIDLEPGDYLSSGTQIVTINDTGTILISFELPERAISILETGKPIQAVTLSKPGAFFQGTITAFDSVIDEATRTVTVRAAIENPDGALWPGMTFAVLMEETSEPLAAVPALAMTWSREGTKVWIEENGTVQPLPVTFRKRINDTVWVEGDLDEGTRVVVDGVQKLRPGASVFVSGSGPENASEPDAQPASATAAQVSG